MSSIAALIITQNEEENIRECLESINWCDEIVLVDSYSEDQTVAISREYTEKIYLRKFDDFAAQRNYALEKVESDWVLVIDADERVSGELKIEIMNEIMDSEHVGYKIPFKNYFLGKWIKQCGWYPDYHLRLFKTRKGIFKNKVHEKIKINGKIKKASGAIEHYTYKSITSFINKTNYYTSLAAEDFYLQRKKFRKLDLMINPLWRFISMFFLRNGFKEGIHGFILSLMYSYYVFVKYAKLWEIYVVDKGRMDGENFGN